MCHAGVSMRIGAIADDTVKLECIIAWCASHPDEVPFAQHHSWAGTTSTRRKSLEHDRAGRLRLQRTPRGASF
jgi:hypothetical protein